MSTYVSIFLSSHQTLYLSSILYIHPSIYLSNYLSIHLSLLIIKQRLLVSVSCRRRRWLLSATPQRPSLRDHQAHTPGAEVSCQVARCFQVVRLSCCLVDRLPLCQVAPLPGYHFVRFPDCQVSRLPGCQVGWFVYWLLPGCWQILTSKHTFIYSLQNI